MAQYLDKDGLGHFYGEVKKRFPKLANPVSAVDISDATAPTGEDYQVIDLVRFTNTNKLGVAIPKVKNALKADSATKAEHATNSDVAKAIKDYGDTSNVKDIKIGWTGTEAKASQITGYPVFIAGDGGTNSAKIKDTTKPELLKGLGFWNAGTVNDPIYLVDGVPTVCQGLKSRIPIADDGNGDSATYGRYVDSKPSYYMDKPSAVTFEFKDAAALGVKDLLGGGTYCTLQTMKPYGSSADDSGGFPHQVVYSNSNNNFAKRIATSTTAWSAWELCKGLKGDKGEKGDPGVAGQAGPRGPVGPDGKPATVGFNVNNDLADNFGTAAVEVIGTPATDARYTLKFKNIKGKAGTIDVSVTSANANIVGTPKVTLTTKPGHTATDAKYNIDFAELKGQPGDRGPIGPVGPAGPQGSQGPTGARAWFVYSVNANGNPCTKTWSAGQNYIGVAVSTSDPGTNYASYTWSKFVGPQGPAGSAGANGQPGANGARAWIVYSINANGNPCTKTWTAGQNYIGVAVSTSDPQTNYASYTWSKFVGPQGPAGANGQPGKDGVNGAAATIDISVTSANANIVGTPKATITTKSGHTATNAKYNIDFANLKGQPGKAGTIDVSVTSANANIVGTPKVTITTKSGHTETDAKYNIDFAELKGQPGAQGAPGKDGTSVTITYSANQDGSGASASFVPGTHKYMVVQNGGSKNTLAIGLMPSVAGTTLTI